MKDHYKIPTKDEKTMIRENVKVRQKLKTKWDKHCKYAEAESANFDKFLFGSVQNKQNNETNYIRLLDEGVVVDGYGEAYAVIKTGVLKKWYESLSSNFVGTINKDHDPSLDLGTFTKEDLRLVEIGNGRYGVDVNVKLDEELYLTKDLLKLQNRSAVSSEFFLNADEYVTASSATGDEKAGDYLIPLINEVKLTGYAIVKNPKNANSYDENILEKASEDINFNQKGEKMDEEENKDLNPTNPVGTTENVGEPVEIKVEKEENAENKSEKGGEKFEATADENGKGESEKGEENNDNETETKETETPATVNPEADTKGSSEEREAGVDAFEAVAKGLKEAIEELKATVVEKDTTIANLTNQIAELNAKLEAKDLEAKKYATDLKALFNVAKPAEKVSDTIREEKQDNYMDELNKAFANL